VWVGGWVGVRMPVLVLVWVDVCVCGILQVDVAPLPGGVSIFDLKKCPVYLKRSPIHSEKSHSYVTINVWLYVDSKRDP